jgi:hypothetical protein
VILATLLLLSNALASDCERPSRTTELANALTAAEAAYLDMDEDGFIAIIAGAEVTLGCLAEAITPYDAAAYHRLVALDAFLAADDAATISAFRASLAAQPRFLLPSSLAPLGNPLSQLYLDASEPYSLNPIALPAPSGRVVLMDGARSTARPTTRPVIVQLVGPDGGIDWSGYLRLDDSNPSWPALGFDEPSKRLDEPRLPEPRENPRESKRRTRSTADSNIRVARQLPKGTPGRTRPLLVAAGGSALVAGGLYALGFGLRLNYDDLQTPYERLDGLRVATNGLVVSSAGAGLVAMGLSVAAVVTVEW